MLTQQLIKIADFADKNGEHDVATNITRIVKDAQLLDAIRTLFDPSYSGIERDAGYWRRLQRGWRQGRMNKAIGLFLAINAERTQVNDQILQITEPFKDFKDEVEAFYGKIRTGSDDINATNLSEEIKSLKRSLKETIDLVSSKRLRKLLDLRTKLQGQEIKALERVKGIPDKAKEQLLNALREGVPISPAQVAEAVTPAAQTAQPVAPAAAIPGEAPAGKKGREPLSPALKKWLADLNLPDMGPRQGFESLRGREGAASFIGWSGVHPKALEAYLEAHPEVYSQALRTFGDAFRDVMNYARRIHTYEAKGMEGVKREAPAPAKEEIPIETPTTPAPEAQEMGPQPSAKEEETAAAAKAVEALRRKREEQQAREVQEYEASRDPRLWKKLKEKPEELFEYPGRLKEETPTTPGAPTPKRSAVRLAKNIDRMSRMNTLKKWAIDEDDEPVDEREFELYEKYNQLPEDVDVLGDLPASRLEQFEEEKDYNPAETRLQMFEGAPFETEEDPGIEFDPDRQRARVEKEETERAERLKKLIEAVEPKSEEIIYNYGGRGVDIGLNSKTDPPGVFWSKGFNSFVLVDDPKGPWVTPSGKRVSLLSINGIGEVRWPVFKGGFGNEGSIEHFKLKPAEEK